MTKFLRKIISNIKKLDNRPFLRLIVPEGEFTISWKQFGDDCNRFANTLAAMELPAHSQILIFIEKSPLLYSSFVGAMLAGHVPSIMPCLTPKQNPATYWGSHRELFKKIKPGLVIANSPVTKQMRDGGIEFDSIKVLDPSEISADTSFQIVSAGEDELALLQHSSGTTGLKKGVALSYHALDRQLQVYSDALKLHEDNSIVSWLPLYHDMGLIACFMLPVWAGLYTVHIDPFQWLSRPNVLFDILVLQESPLCWMPNFSFEHLANTCGRRAGQYDLSRVAAFISCSEVVKEKTMSRFCETFKTSGIKTTQLQACYAMAETVFAVAQSQISLSPFTESFTERSLEIGSVPVVCEKESSHSVALYESGVVLDGIDLIFSDLNGNELPEGAVGEICLSGDFIFSGYNQAPEETEKRFRNGKFCTRDVGFRLGKHLFVMGRIDDIIIINGRNIYAHEVEMVISELKGVKPGRVVAFSIFDSRAGSEVLILQLEKMVGMDVPEGDFARVVTEIVYSTFSIVPHDIVISDENSLIKTTSGKMSRKENREKYLSLRGNASA